MDHSYCTHRNKYLAKDHCYFRTSKKTPAVIYQKAGCPVVSLIGYDHSYTKYCTAFKHPIAEPEPEPIKKDEVEAEVDAFTAAMLQHVWIKEEKLTAQDLERLGAQLAAQRDKDHTYTQPERSEPRVLPSAETSQKIPSPLFRVSPLPSELSQVILHTT